MDAVPDDPVQPVGVGRVDVAPVELERLLEPEPIVLGHGRAGGIPLVERVLFGTAR